MYNNVGGTIKTLSKGIFIIEAIGAIIAGANLIATDDDFILLGLLILFCGPIIAWISSLILYAFGELVEDTHAIRYIRYLQADESSKHENTPLTEPSNNKDANILSEINNTINSKVPYWCGKCGHEGPYEGYCPKCNSSLKKYNV